MEKKTVYERDLLYPIAENGIGTIHVDVFELGRDSKVPVIIESKSKHIPMDYMDEIINVLQKEIFNRLNIDVRESVVINIKSNQEIRVQYGDKNYIRLSYADGEPIFEGIDVL